MRLELTRVGLLVELPNHYTTKWTPAYGQSKAGRPARTYIQQLCDDTGCNPEDLPVEREGQGYPCWPHDMMMMTYIVTKIYNALLLNCIDPKIEKILRKNENGFQKKRSTTSQILTIR